MMDEQTTAPRLPYTPPELKTFGSLTQMTQMLGNMGLRDGGAMNTQKTR